MRFFDQSKKANKYFQYDFTEALKLVEIVKQQQTYKWCVLSLVIGNK